MKILLNMEHSYFVLIFSPFSELLGFCMSEKDKDFVVAIQYVSGISKISQAYWSIKVKNNKKHKV